MQLRGKLWPDNGLKDEVFIIVLLTLDTLGTTSAISTSRLTFSTIRPEVCITQVFINAIAVLKEINYDQNKYIEHKLF